MALLLIAFFAHACSWQNDETSIFQHQRYIGHAFGEIDGNTYTNSLEAFHENYAKGLRVFEVDLSITAHGRVVCFHNGLEADYGLDKKINEVTLAEFKQKRIREKYTPLDIIDLVGIMNEHRDIYIVTDTKGDIAHILWSFVQEAMRVNEDAARRIIPQIYHEEDYERVKDIYPFTEIIYTLYRGRDGDEEVLKFIGDKKDIRMVTVHKRRFNSHFAERVSRMGKRVFVHTVNDPSVMSKLESDGAAGFYTDAISDRVAYASAVR